MKDSEKPLVITICLLVLAGSLWSIFKPNGSAILSNKELEILKSNATMNAKAVADFMGGKGSAVLLSLDLPNTHGLEEFQKSFADYFAERGISVTEKVFRPENAKHLYVPGWNLPADYLMEAARENPDADWIVSLAGIPTVEAISSQKWNESNPGIIVGRSFGSTRDLPSLINQGLVAMAIVPLISVGEASSSETAQQCFERMYTIVTATSETIPIMAPP